LLCPASRPSSCRLKPLTIGDSYAAEYGTRRERAAAAARDQGFAALLVADPANMCYLTDYNAWSFYMPQFLLLAAGMYLTFIGLTNDQLVKAGGAGAKLVEAYKAKYGKDPDGSYPLYGVTAIQVILAAIAKSDGTRRASPRRC
jgi:Xaa-Pro aminopeptidase